MDYAVIIPFCWFLWRCSLELFTWSVILFTPRYVPVLYNVPVPGTSCLCLGDAFMLFLFDLLKIMVVLGCDVMLFDVTSYRYCLNLESDVMLLKVVWRNQCFGFGSGSAWFCIKICLLDPDPHGQMWIRIQEVKKPRKCTSS